MASKIANMAMKGAGSVSKIGATPGSRLRPSAKAIFSLTPSARKRVQELMSDHMKQSNLPARALRIDTKAGGCNGWRYVMDFVPEIPKGDEVVESEGLTISVAPKALLAVVGTEMDYVDNKLKSEFTFNNPNAEGTCGCGESFNVAL